MESPHASNIDFMIKALESNPDKKFIVLEGSGPGDTLLIVWRSANEKAPGPYYEIRVAEIKETAFIQAGK